MLAVLGRFGPQERPKNANRKTAFGKEDVERLREGKPLKDKEGNRQKARLSEGAEITGSLIKIERYWIKTSMK